MLDFSVCSSKVSSNVHSPPQGKDGDDDELPWVAISSASEPHIKIALFQQLTEGEQGMSSGSSQALMDAHLYRVSTKKYMSWEIHATYDMYFRVFL